MHHDRRVLVHTMRPAFIATMLSTHCGSRGSVEISQDYRAAQMLSWKPCYSAETTTVPSVIVALHLRTRSQRASVQLLLRSERRHKTRMQP